MPKQCDLCDNQGFIVVKEPKQELKIKACHKCKTYDTDEKAVMAVVNFACLWLDEMERAAHWF